MSEAQLTVRGLREQIREMEQREKRAKNLEPALRPVAERFKALIDQSFATSTSPSGEAWPALSPRTIARKQRKGYSAQPLIRRGARGLQGSIGVEASGTGIRFSVLAPYGIYHQSEAPRSRLPQRAFLPLRIGGPTTSLMNSPRVRSIVSDLKRRVVQWVVKGKR